jgi:hypothetical protein
LLATANDLNAGTTTVLAGRPHTPPRTIGRERRLQARFEKVMQIHAWQSYARHPQSGLRSIRRTFPLFTWAKPRYGPLSRQTQ